MLEQIPVVHIIIYIYRFYQENCLVYEIRDMRL